MKTQLNEIEKFVESISSEKMTNEQQSLVLSVPTQVIGGTNTGGCTNGDTESCGTVNKKCTNMYGVCDFSTNKRGCNNIPLNPGTGGN